MTHNPKILEALVKAISAAYDDALMHGEREAAAAVLELVEPRELEWESPCEANNQCHIARTARGDYYVDVDGGRHQAWMENLTEASRFDQYFDTIEAAQAAAQAHADAAHWSNTPLGKLVGVV